MVLRAPMSEHHATFLRPLNNEPLKCGRNFPEVDHISLTAHSLKRQQGPLDSSETFTNTTVLLTPTLAFDELHLRGCRSSVRHTLTSYKGVNKIHQPPIC